MGPYTDQGTLHSGDSTGTGTGGNDTLVLHSTRDSWRTTYHIGELRLTPGADPLDPASWTKTGPVFTGNAAMCGVRHASLTTSPDGTESLIMYYSKTSATPGWDRDIRMQKFTWSGSGEPIFGDAVQASQSIARPSGECP